MAEVIEAITAALEQCPICLEYCGHIALLPCCLTPCCQMCYHDSLTSQSCCLHRYQNLPVTTTQVNEVTAADLAAFRADLATKLDYLQTCRRKTVKFYHKVSQVSDIKLDQPLQHYQQADLKAIDQVIELYSLIQVNQANFNSLTSLPEFSFSHSVNWYIFHDATEMVRLPPVWPPAVYEIFSQIVVKEDLDKMYCLCLAIAKQRGFTVVLTRCVAMPNTSDTTAVATGQAILDLLAAAYPHDHSRANTSILASASWSSEARALQRLVLIDLRQDLPSLNQGHRDYNRNLSRRLTNTSINQIDLTQVNGSRKTLRRIIVADHTATAAKPYDGPEAIRVQGGCYQARQNLRGDFVTVFSDFITSLRKL